MCNAVSYTGIIIRARIIVLKGAIGVIKAIAFTDEKPWSLEILRDCPRHRAIFSELQHSCLLVEAMLLHPLSDYSPALLTEWSRAGSTHHLQHHLRAWRAAKCMSRCNLTLLSQERRKRQAFSARLLDIWNSWLLILKRHHVRNFVLLNSVHSWGFLLTFFRW